MISSLAPPPKVRKYEIRGWFLLRYGSPACAPRPSIAAAPMGIIGGLAQAALTDLAIRACPPRLQGTMMMLFGSSIYFFSTRFGDLLGTEIYDHWGGFNVAVWATIGIYALILPVILLVPRRLIATRDGEALQGAG